MAECDWALLCDYAFRDAGRKMCLIGIFDRVQATRVPTALHQSSLVFKLVGDPGEKVSVSVQIIRPSNSGGGSLADLNIDAELSETGMGEIQLGMNGLPLPDFGVYTFQILGNGDLLKAISVTVAEQKREG